MMVWRSWFGVDASSPSTHSAVLCLTCRLCLRPTSFQESTLLSKPCWHFMPKVWGHVSVNLLFLHTRWCRKKTNEVLVRFKFYVTSKCFSLLSQNQNDGSERSKQQSNNRTRWWYSVMNLPCCRPADWGGGGLWWRRDTHLPSVRGLQPASLDQAPGHRWQGHHTLPHQGTAHALTSPLTTKGIIWRTSSTCTTYTCAHLNVKEIFANTLTTDSPQK